MYPCILCSGALIPIASSLGRSPEVPQAVRTPNKKDLIFMSATALAEAIRAKRVSSEEVYRVWKPVEQYLGLVRRQPGGAALHRVDGQARHAWALGSGNGRAVHLLHLGGSARRHLDRRYRPAWRQVKTPPGSRGGRAHKALEINFRLALLTTCLVFGLL